ILTIGRSAVLTRVHKGRAACHYCGVCHRGCITQSYFSSLNSTLPAAMKTGKLTLRPYSVVHSLIFDPSSRRVTGVRVIDGKTKHKDFLRGYGYQGGGSRDGWQRGMSTAGLGVDFKNSLRKPGQWRMGLGGFGECLPNHNNYVEIDKDKLDAWGIPTLKIHCDWGDNERIMSKDIAVQAAEMLAAAGATNIGVYSEMTRPGLGIHEMGTARMGRDPKT